jgi:hypothetical protein
MESRDAQAWVEMRHALCPDATLDELHQDALRYFERKSRYVTAAFIAESDAPIGLIEINLRG